MTLDVKFEEQDQTFNTNFGEIQTVSDGGFERGYNEGYAQGEVEGYDKGKTDGRVEGEQVGFDNAVSKLTTLEVTENGEYTPSDDNIGFDKVTVNIGGEEKSQLAKFAEGTLTEITADDLKGITYVADYAFSSFPSSYVSKIIKKITLPNTVTYLGKYAFYTSHFEEIILNEGITSFGEHCFSSCNTPIEVPSTVVDIGKYAFEYVTGEIKWKENSQITVLGELALKGYRLKGILKLPDSIIELGKSSIAYSSYITDIKFPAKLEIIRYQAMYTCGALTNITIPDTVTLIEASAFASCNLLESIVTSSSLKSFGTGIGSSIFNGCSALKTITMRATTPPNIYSNLISSSSNPSFEKIIVPKGCGEAYKTATNWSDFADYIEEATE